jgi:hypothetical protein
MSEYYGTGVRPHSPTASRHGTGGSLGAETGGSQAASALLSIQLISLKPVLLSQFLLRPILVVSSLAR